MKSSELDDLRHCQRILQSGSKSFAAAGLILPARVRKPAAAVYAFCRVADDAVDMGSDPQRAVSELHARLDAIYADHPRSDPVDRAFCRVVHTRCIPESVPRALLEGFLWDAERRTYSDLEALEAYCARVASSVGVMMALLMGVRDRSVLARACDLGLAMQMTNICRDVGEDARAGRIYLPLDWLSAEGVDTARLRAAPRFSPELGCVVRRLLDVAAELYVRADSGISRLPGDCRPAIRAARLVYAAIGKRIARSGYDSISARAHTSRLCKLGLLLRACGALWWRPRPCDEPTRPATASLVEASGGD
ncbi:MAG: phytoene/squalene synthase family protein [Deltaproteobacteria bacterium]|nr:phytoene/squalene synthase family protein [Deltaproteobacteria bacterium]